MEKIELTKELNSLEYHGRGIILGKSPDGKKAVIAYFIMGRSENSRNRVFVEDGEGIRTQAFDPSKTATYKQNVVMAEYLGNSITPKTYWTRSSSITDNNKGCTYQIDWDGEVITVEDAYESTGMVIPFITIG